MYVLPSGGAQTMPLLRLCNDHSNSPRSISKKNTTHDNTRSSSRLVKVSRKKNTTTTLRRKRLITGMVMMHVSVSGVRTVFVVLILVSRFFAVASFYLQ